jgi:hypothetical protein
VLEDIYFLVTRLDGRPCGQWTVTPGQVLDLYMYKDNSLYWSMKERKEQSSHNTLSARTDSKKKAKKSINVHWRSHVDLPAKQLKESPLRPWLADHKAENVVKHFTEFLLDLTLSGNFTRKEEPKEENSRIGGQAGNRTHENLRKGTGWTWNDGDWKESRA